MCVYNILLLSELPFIFQNIDVCDVARLEVTVEALKTFSELLGKRQCCRARFLGFEFSYLGGELCDAGLDCTCSPLEGT